MRALLISYNLLMGIVIYLNMEYNKNVILTHKKHNNNVKECFYGTIYFEKFTGLEEFSLP